jgi:hypothetical protein
MERVTESPSSAVAAINRIVDAAVKAGWEHEEGFRAAMLLLTHGITVAEAEQRFRQCERVIQ